MMNDRRNFSRVDFRVSALLQAEGVAIKGEVADVSLHGLYIETEERLQVGTPVEVTIYLSAAPDPIVINVKGTVARQMPGGLGCNFDRMDVESFAHLRSIISYQGGDESKVMAEFSEYIAKKLQDE